MTDETGHAQEESGIDQSEMGYDPDAPPCRYCGAHLTHWTKYHGSYDCHCECCGKVFKSRSAKFPKREEEMDDS